MVNPNEYIRTGYITAFAGINVPVWAKKVPKDKTPTPLTYILLHSQTKNPTAEDKDTQDEGDIEGDGPEWLCTIVVDIVSIREAGYSKPKILDDLEEQVLNAVRKLKVPGFIVKSTELVDSTDLDSDTNSQTIERRILTYQHWLNNID